MHVVPEEGLYNININVRDNFMKSSFDVKLSFKKFHRAVFSIAHPEYSNVGSILNAKW
jgi:hypothetical protein